MTEVRATNRQPRRRHSLGERTRRDIRVVAPSPAVGGVDVGPDAAFRRGNPFGRRPGARRSLGRADAAGIKGVQRRSRPWNSGLGRSGRLRAAAPPVQAAGSHYLFPPRRSRGSSRPAPQDSFGHHSVPVLQNLRTTTWRSSANCPGWASCLTTPSLTADAFRHLEGHPVETRRIP